eukprot:gene2227-4260_t
MLKVLARIDLLPECSFSHEQRLYLNDCTTLKVLPDSVGNCVQLQTLGLDSCTTLKVLPDSAVTTWAGRGLAAPP